MKKILFLLFLFVIKLSAYEYVIQDVINQSRFYSNDNVFGLYSLNKNDNISTKIPESTAYTVMSNLRVYSGQSLYGYIEVSQFVDYYKNDLIFLNDLYTKEYYNVFLNFLYNNNEFNSSNYINYNDYELLYNDKGLAVESIVDGVWAGLYDDSQKTRSGALYDSTGNLRYYNGKAVDPVTSFLVWFQSFTRRVVLDVFMEIKRSVVPGIIMTVVCTLAVMRVVLLFLPSAISRSHYGGRPFRSGGSGGGSLPDFGDGRAVAASVRERLAAKNRRLKS